MCAASFAAAVAESPLTGPGAGGFLTVALPGREPTVLDFFVAVPGLGAGGLPVDPDRFESFRVPFGGAEQVFHIGPATVATPGMIPGLVDAVSRFGRRPLSELVVPAIRLARDGVIVTPELAYLHEILAVMLTASPEAAALFAPQGRMHRPGERLCIPDLADTFEEIVSSGPGAIRTGALADRIVDHVADRGGTLTATDLRTYTVIEREPLTGAHRGVSVVTNPPPSAGGELIVAALAAMAGTPDRDETVYYRSVAAAGAAANVHRLARESPPASGHRWKPTGTTNVSAIDAEGGLASLSSSCGSGGGVVVPGTGILLNNMLGETDLNPGGFGRQPAGERMRSMMAPSLLLRGGEPVAALGSAGSNRLRSAIVQTIVRLVDHGDALEEAVRRPRVHVEDGIVDVEGGVSDAVVAALEADGHVVRRWDTQNLYFGGVSIAGFSAGELSGAGDPRRGGAAAGVTAAGEIIDL